MDKRLLSEFAGASRDVFNMPLMAGILRNLDKVLQQQAGGTGLNIYEDLERDAQVFAVLQKRKMAVVQRPWTVLAANDSLRAKKAAEFVLTVLNNLAFDRLCLDLLDAVLKGYSVVEVMWAMQGDYLLPASFIARDQRRFVFDEAYQPRLLTSGNMTKGEELPARKFITHAQGGKDGTPYGLGLGSKLYWPVVFKRQSISFWLAYAERVGTPTVVATHPELMPSDQIDKVAAAADGVGQESSITIPNSVVLNLLEPKSGNVAYQPLVDYMDKQISIAVLGETLTTNSSPTGMGSSTATVHNEVRLELTEADAVLLAGTLNATLVKWLVELNLGHNDVPRVAWDFSKPEDLKVRAERDEIVGRMSGTRPTLKYVQDTYGGEWEPVAPVAPPDPVNAPLAAKAALSTVVGEIGQDAENNLSDAATPLVDDLLQSVQKMVNDAPDMGALQTALLQAYGGLNSDDLVKLMAAAFALAELKGMDDVAHAQ